MTDRAKDKFWVLREHHGYKRMFEVADEVMPSVLMFFEDDGQAEYLVEESGVAELQEAWETANNNPTVNNVLRFMEEWEYAGCDDDNVSFVYIEEFVTKESINNA